MARMAASRPGPGPFTNTSNSRKPRSFAARMTTSAAFLAAKGVLFREPLNPDEPALPQTTTFPCGSEMVTIVLLKVAWMFARPLEIVRLILLRFDSLRAIPVHLPRSHIFSALRLGECWTSRSPELLLLGAPSTAASRNGLFRALSGAGIRTRALASHRQVPSMPQPPIAADVNEALNIQLHLAPKIPLHHKVLGDIIPNRADLAFGEIANGSVRIDPGSIESCLRRRSPDPMDVGQPNENSLVTGEIDAFNSCHVLTLPLLVARVFAYNVNLAAPADNLALGTTLGNRCRNLHVPTFSLAGRVTKY